LLERNKKFFRKIEKCQKLLSFCAENSKKEDRSQKTEGLASIVFSTGSILKASFVIKPAFVHTAAFDRKTSEHQSRVNF
jgi:hypothetical protein